MPSVPRSQIKAEVLHCYNPADNEDKVYAVWIENRGGTNPFCVNAANGPRVKQGMLTVQPKGAYRTLPEAERQMSNVVNQKIKKGYKSVELPSYLSNSPIMKVRFDDVINDSKIDTSRIVGLAAGGAASTIVVPVAAKQNKQKTNTQAGSGRVSRSVSL